MKKYNIRFIMKNGIFTEIVNIKIEDIKKYIDKNITSKDFITFIDDEKNEVVVINLNNVLRVEFKEVKGDD